MSNMFDDKILKSLLLKFRKKESYDLYRRINREVEIRVSFFFRRLVSRYGLTMSEYQRKDIIDDCQNYFWVKQYSKDPIRKSYSYFLFRRVQYAMFHTTARNIRIDQTVELPDDSPLHHDNTIDDVARSQNITLMLARIREELEKMDPRDAMYELKKLIGALTYDTAHKIKKDEENTIHWIIYEALSGGE